MTFFKISSIIYIENKKGELKLEFYIIRTSTNERIMSLYKDTLEEASYYIYKWYGDDNDVDVILAEE